MASNNWLKSCPCCGKDMFSNELSAIKAAKRLDNMDPLRSGSKRRVYGDCPSGAWHFTSDRGR